VQVRPVNSKLTGGQGGTGKSASVIGALVRRNFHACRKNCFLVLGASSSRVAGDAQRFTENDKRSKNYLSKVTTFFQRLEIALTEKGKSKSALADHLGMALSGISRWKDSLPRAERVQEITSWLNVSGKWLMTGEGAMHPILIGQKKPGDVIRETEVKEICPPSENKPSDRDEIHRRMDSMEKAMERVEKELGEMRDMMKLMNHALVTLLAKAQADEGIGLTSTTAGGDLKNDPGSDPAVGRSPRLKKAVNDGLKNRSRTDERRSIERRTAQLKT